MKKAAPFHIAAIKGIIVFTALYLTALFILAKVCNIHYGGWTYTMYWVPAYLVNVWIILFIRWIKRTFSLPSKLYLLIFLCYLMFLIIGLGYDWVMIFAGTWYFDSQSVLGFHIIEGYDIFGRPCSVPFEELMFDLTFLPFGCLVVAAAFFKFYSITLIFQKQTLHFKAQMHYRGFQLPTELCLVEVDDLDEFIAAYDPRDAATYSHLIRKEICVVEGTPIARLFPFIKF